MHIKKILIILVAVFFNSLLLNYTVYGLCFNCGPAYAADIQWSGKGGTASWQDYLNWFPETVPGSNDNVIIDLSGADVSIGKTFGVKSLKIGEHNSASLTVENFVYGTIAPNNLTDNAIYLGKNGTLNLVGSAGLITLKGSLVLGKKAAVAEPSFMLQVQ